MKRRIKCDCALPKCQKCQIKGLECPGYGTRYRFSNGLASRGKLKGRTVPLGVPDVDGARQPPTSRLFQSALAVDHRAVQADAETTQVITRTEPRLHASIDLMDPKTRMLFAHFSEKVSPTMVLLDQVNGYRHYVLPFAVTDPVAQRAVCVAAAFHLYPSMPSLRKPAEAGRAAILTKLRTMAVQCKPSEILSDATWATIILLLVADLIVAGDDMQTVLKMLLSFVEAKRASSNTGLLATFLGEQTELVKFFAQPILDEERGVERLSTEAAAHMSFISTVIAKAGPSSRSMLLQNDQAFRQACRVYLFRALGVPSESSGDETKSVSDGLKEILFTVDPQAPGAHALVWPYFVAGAESSEERERGFFAERLQHLREVTGYANVQVALDTLKELWASTSGERWTARLPKTTSVIIM